MTEFSMDAKRNPQWYSYTDKLVVIKWFINTRAAIIVWRPWSRLVHIMLAQFYKCGLALGNDDSIVAKIARITSIS